MMSNIKWVNKAAQAMIRYDMQTESNIAVVTFNNQTKVEHSMTKLDSEDIREKVADTVPGKYQLVEHNDSCVRCMLETVVSDVVVTTQEVHIIVLVSGAGVDDDVADVVGDARVSFIIVPGDETVSEVRRYDEVSSETGGDTFLVARTQHEVELYYNIVTDLQECLGGHKSSRVSSLHTNHHHGYQTHSQGSFFTSDNNIMFRIYVPDTEDHMIKSVTFENLDTGRVFGPYRKMSASYDLINFKTPNIVGDNPWEYKTGERNHWNYTVEWFTAAGHEDKSIIDVTSAPDDQSPLRLESWISSEHLCDDEFQHVKISAVLSSPHVSGVEVVASVSVLLDNATMLTLPPLLLDTYDSGVLTTTLLSYPGPGRYSVSVRAEDLITGDVTRDSRDHVVTLTSVPSYDCVPPATITDLSIAIYNNSDVITAVWTSPGSDLNSGDSPVDMFQLLVAEDACELMEGVDVETLLSVQTRATRGDLVEQVLHWTRYDTLYYVGVVAVDAAGNTGKLSNIVSVYVPAPASPEPEPVSLSASESILDNYQAIIIISSSLGGVLMICLLCIVYIIINGRYQSNKAGPGSGSSTPDYTVDTCSHGAPGDQGVTDVQQILARERQSHGHTALHGAQVPVYWSCSEILTRTNKDLMPGVHQPGHNYYNCEDMSASPHSRYSCSSDSYSGDSQDSYRQQSSVATTVTHDATDEGYDSTSRELELINSRKLFTIV